MFHDPLVLCNYGVQKAFVLPIVIKDLYSFVCLFVAFSFYAASHCQHNGPDF